MSLEEAFRAHTKEDHDNFQGVHETQKEIKDTLDKIETNHLAHIQASIGSIETNLATQTEKSKWMEKLMLIALTGIGGGFIAAIFNLITK